MLLGLFPANVYAAVNDIPFRGSAPTPLWLRGPVQLVFVLSVWWVALRPRTEPQASELDERQQRNVTDR